MGETYLVAPPGLAERWRDQIRPLHIQVARSQSDISGQPDNVLLIDQPALWPTRLGTDTSLLWQGTATRAERDILRDAAKRAGFDRRFPAPTRNTITEERYFRSSGGSAEVCFHFITPNIQESQRREAAASFVQQNTRRNDGRLTLTISGFRSERGAVSVLLFDQAKAFADADPRRAVAQAMVDVAGSETRVLLSGLRIPGIYAGLVLHDENKNGRMDTSFGFPTEGFGATNNPKFGFGPPPWKDCCFRLAPENPKNPSAIAVKIVYLVR